MVAFVGNVEQRWGPNVPSQQASLTATDQASTAPEPFTVGVPDIGVNARLHALGQTRNGSLAVPRDPQQVGWWSADGQLDFDTGPVVLVGHRDSRTGPAVFYAAPSLLRGESIRVTDGSGRVHDFVVDRVERHSREAFPTLAVYGDTPGPSLRLLTCGGEFTPGKGYADNWIVFATAA